jgi:predicted XRE-type DNA-binding protein
MQQYQQSVNVKKPAAVAETSTVEQRLMQVVNRLIEQNELQARQIRRLESDVTVLRESVRSNLR